MATIIIVITLNEGMSSNCGAMQRHLTISVTGGGGDREAGIVVTFWLRPSRQCQLFPSTAQGDDGGRHPSNGLTWIPDSTATRRVKCPLVMCPVLGTFRQHPEKWRFRSISDYYGRHPSSWRAPPLKLALRASSLQLTTEKCFSHSNSGHLFWKLFSL